jgi:hypothetical protein
MLMCARVTAGTQQIGHHSEIFIPLLSLKFATINCKALLKELDLLINNPMHKYGLLFDAVLRS